MKFSDRASWNTDSNRIALELAKKAAEGRTILDLTESNPTRCRFEALNPSLLAPFSDPSNLAYQPDPRGLAQAREAVAGYYRTKGVRVDAADIILTASTSEAYGFLFQLIANPGDAIAVPQPSYPLFEFLAGLHDVRLTPYRYAYDGAWSLEAGWAATAGMRDAKAVILVNPNNPTGHFLSKQEAKSVEDFCRAQGCAVIADEVFLDFGWAADVRPAFAGADGVLSFSLGGVSKMLGLPQMKLSWIAVSGPAQQKNEALLRLEVIADTYLSVNTPSQRALQAWLASRKAIQDEIRNRILKNRTHLQKSSLARHLLKGEGGWYAILRLDADRDDEEVVLTLLREHDVNLLPGYLFDFPLDHSFLILSLIPPHGIFEEAVCRMEKCLRNLNIPS